jgi:hypothetical protein
MDGSQAYTLRKTARTLIWDSYRSQMAGNFTSLVDNHVTEFKYVNFWTYEKIANLKDSQLEIMEV